MKKIISVLLAVTLLISAAVLFTSCGKKVLIGVQSGTTGEFYVNGDEDWGFDGLKGYKTSPYSNAGLAVADMKNGAVKYVIVDEAPAKQLVKSISGIKVIDIPLTEEEYAYGVDKNQPELRANINKILSEDKDEIAKIIAKYFSDGAVLTPVESATQDDSKADKQLVIATNAAFAPFEYKEGNKFLGIDIEIMKYIADKLGLELVVQDMDFDSVVTSVGKNGVDVAAAGLTVNDTRKQSVDFSDSYYNAAQMLIVLNEETSFDACKTADDVVAQLAANLK